MIIKGQITRSSGKNFKIEINENVIICAHLGYKRSPSHDCGRKQTVKGIKTNNYDPNVPVGDHQRHSEGILRLLFRTHHFFVLFPRINTISNDAGNDYKYSVYCTLNDYHFACLPLRRMYPKGQVGFYFKIILLLEYFTHL